MSTNINVNRDAEGKNWITAWARLTNTIPGTWRDNLVECKSISISSSLTFLMVAASSFVEPSRAQDELLGFYPVRLTPLA